jgi:hypothetical protein
VGHHDHDVDNYRHYGLLPGMDRYRDDCRTLFTPIAAKLGFDPIWFTLMNIIVLQTSFLTPPFAYAIFYLKGVAPPEVTLNDIL